MTTSKSPSQPVRRPRRRNDGCMNFLALLALLGIFLLGGYIAYIYLNPTSFLNPFPPPALPEPLVIQTATAAPVDIPATVVPEPTDSVETEVPAEPTAALAPTNTPQPAAETPTPYMSAYPFALQSLPVRFPSSVFHSEAGCNWMGVAGQVFDLSGRPVIGLVVRLGGSLNGRVVDITTLTGGASQWYGESGYEFVIADKPVDSSSSLWIQLYDQGNIPISERIKFDTSSKCEENLVIINFKQGK